MPFQDDFIHRQRASLIRTENVHCSKILYCIDPLDDHFFAAHGNSAFRKTDRHDHR